MLKISRSIFVFLTKTNKYIIMNVTLSISQNEFSLYTCEAFSRLCLTDTITIANKKAKYFCENVSKHIYNYRKISSIAHKRKEFFRHLIEAIPGRTPRTRQYYTL
jgi:uncharacterized FlgJ-related protein